MPHARVPGHRGQQDWRAGPVGRQHRSLIISQKVLSFTPRVLQGLHTAMGPHRGGRDGVHATDSLPESVDTEGSESEDSELGQQDGSTDPHSKAGRGQGVVRMDWDLHHHPNAVSRSYVCCRESLGLRCRQ